MGNRLNTVCDCCGRKENIQKMILNHSFGGYAGYGSEHDGEYITLTFCSECLDNMLRARKTEEGGDSQR